MTPLHDWARRHQIPPAALAELPGLFAPNVPPSRPEPGTEADVMIRLRLAAQNGGGVLWRNNSGAARDTTGRVIRYGLGNDSARLNETFKSSDLIGVTPVRVGLEHFGRCLGVFTAVEAKRLGWTYSGTDREAAQLRFINAVRALGGFAGFAAGPDGLKTLGEHGLQ